MSKPQTGRVPKPRPEDYRLVPDPSMSDAQFWHERHQAPDDPNVGMVLRRFELKTLIGGFAHYGGAEHQIAAAAKFKRVYELAQVGGTKACDFTREPVDGGGPNPEAAIELGYEARKDIVNLQKRLGMEMFKRIERVVIGGTGPTAYVRKITGNPRPSAKMVSRAKVEVRRIANNMAEYWKLSTVQPQRTD